MLNRVKTYEHLPVGLTRALLNIFFALLLFLMQSAIRLVSKKIVVPPDQQLRRMTRTMATIPPAVIACIVLSMVPGGYAGVSSGVEQVRE